MGSFLSQVSKFTLDLITKGILVTQMVKNLPEVWENWVRSLSQEDPLEKKWQSTAVFLPGKSHGQRSLAGYSQWGRKELNMTE